MMLEGGIGMLEKVAGHPALYGLLVAAAIGIVGGILLAGIFYLTPLSEIYLQPAGTTVYLLGAFIGGLLAARKAGNRGVLLGIEVGGLYFLLFLILLLILSPRSLSAFSLFLKGVYTLVIAAAGGVIGIAFTD
jgi:putative membrane protein (TIGR04086 family)